VRIARREASAAPGLCPGVCDAGLERRRDRRAGYRGYRSPVSGSGWVRPRLPDRDRRVHGGDLGAVGYWPRTSASWSAADRVRVRGPGGLSSGAVHGGAGHWYHPRHSLLGIIWTAVTAAVMFALASGKARTGRALDSPVLQTEGRVTMIGILAVAVLLGPGAECRDRLVVGRPCRRVRAHLLRRPRGTGDLPRTPLNEDRPVMAPSYSSVRAPSRSAARPTESASRARATGRPDAKPIGRHDPHRGRQRSDHPAVSRTVRDCSA
jgi:hypothetical protein